MLTTQSVYTVNSGYVHAVHLRTNVVVHNTFPSYTVILLVTSNHNIEINYKWI